MELDLVEKRILQFASILFFFIFLFSFDLGMKILFSSAILFFLIFFNLCTYWANEWHPERKFIIGFLVSFLHTFLYVFSGFLGFFFSFLFLKFLPVLVDFFKGIFTF